MITTVADLFSRYSDLCGEMGPAMTRDELRADFQEWCAAHDVAARYETSWEAYLKAQGDDDGGHRGHLLVRQSSPGSSFGAGGRLDGWA
jgi:hypothetical protein